MRLTDADALLKRICELCGAECNAEDKEKCVEWEFAHDAVESLPTVDAKPVVRCKDCIYYFADGCDECRLMIAKSITASIMDKRWYSDFFCAWGERREDDDTTGGRDSNDTVERDGVMEDN